MFDVEYVLTIINDNSYIYRMFNKGSISCIMEYGDETLYNISMPNIVADYESNPYKYQYNKCFKVAMHNCTIGNFVDKLRLWKLSFSDDENYNPQVNLDRFTYADFIDPNFNYKDYMYFHRDCNCNMEKIDDKLIGVIFMCLEAIKSLITDKQEEREDKTYA